MKLRVRFIMDYQHKAFEHPIHRAGQEVDLNEHLARIVVKLGYAEFVETAVAQ